MTLKTGDYVRVLNTVAPNKCEFIGKTFKIKCLSAVIATDSRKGKAYCVEDCDYVFYDTELEMIAFPKEELKDGMLVQYRDGSFRLVLNGLLMGETRHDTMNDFDSDLTCKLYDAYDIMKVYKSMAHCFSELYEESCMELIWSRDRLEPKEMTMGELEDLLGYKVKIID